MKTLSHENAYQVLLLQLGDEGRDKVLLGDSAARARVAALPFLVGEEFPNVYLEFPLIGDPFLDVTMLYSNLAPGTRVESEAAADTEALFDWFATIDAKEKNMSFGFELDTHEPELPRAAIHFQPRAHREFVEPFFRAVGEPERAHLYLDLAARMPAGWDLSFFGMFRGRKDSPLRVCGYLSGDSQDSCAADPKKLQEVFDEIGFTAYDDTMLAQASALMAVRKNNCDFQFDVYPDGSLGDIFAIDAQFQIEQPQAVRDSFDNGVASRLFGLLEKWGAADSRWRLAAGSAFARALPIELEDGSAARFSFALMPQWTKARWHNKVLQPSKLYCLANAKVLT